MTPTPDQPPDPATLSGVMRAWARTRGAGTALIVGPSGERLSGDEFLQLCDHVAARLSRSGVVEGSRVGLLAENRPGWLAALEAAGRLGAQVFGLSTWSTPAEIDALVKFGRLDVVIATEEYRGRPYLQEITDLVAANADSTVDQVFGFDDIATGTDRPTDTDAAASISEADRGPGEPAVVFTSGSSGLPKGVLLSADSLIRTADLSIPRVGANDNDVVWIAVPMFWAFGLANAMMVAMRSGAAICLEPLFEPASSLRFMHESQATFYYGPALMTRKLIDAVAAGGPAPIHLRTGISATPLLLEDLGVRSPCTLYGSSEAHGNCTLTRFDEPREQRVLTQGTPLEHRDLKIFDADGKAVPTGLAGEICVRGGMARYLDHPSPFDADAYFHTGDLGYLDEGGRLNFVGRRGSVLRVGSRNVTPDEVEIVLLRDPRVVAAAVVGIPKDADDEVVAFVEAPNIRDKLGLAVQLREECRQHLSVYKVPTRVIVLDALPVTGTGKIDRMACRELV